MVHFSLLSFFFSFFLFFASRSILFFYYFIAATETDKSYPRQDLSFFIIDFTYTLPITRLRRRLCPSIEIKKMLDFRNF